MTELIALLKKYKVPLENEKVAQRKLAIIFSSNNLNFEKEKELDDSSIIDFYFPDIKTGLEIKIATTQSKKKIYKQVARYCNYECVESVILLTNKGIGMPEVINNKKVVVLTLASAWL